MKRIVLFLTFISCILNAGDIQDLSNDSKLFNVTSINNIEIKKYLLGLEKFNYELAIILKDYFIAKTCQTEFYNYSTIEELSNFQFTNEYEQLQNSYNNNKLYTKLIKKYNTHCKGQ